jgi:hypothetical protein
MILPATLVVQRSRSRQPPHADLNVALPWLLMVRVIPAGQVMVPLTSSTAKSSTVNPPWTAGRIGAGLTRSTWPRWARFGAEFP